MRGPVLAAVAVTVSVLGAGVSVAQPARSPVLKPADSEMRAREAALRKAIEADGSTVGHYFALADFYKEHGRIPDADRVLRDALDVAPRVGPVFERRLLLQVKPLNVSMIGSLALEWLSLDGLNPLPVLIVAGHRLRRASGLRGDGTKKAETEIELALQVIDGALPANPDVPALLLAKSNLVLAKAMLMTDAKQQASLTREAQELFQRAGDGKESPVLGPHSSTSLSPVLGPMLQMPPFGPPGALRAPALVPIPKRIKDLRPAREVTSPQPSGGFLSSVVQLELVVDQSGHVMQIHITNSVDGFTDAWADAIQKWEYEPTLVKGQPVTVILNAVIYPWETTSRR